ncbi:hypothetical protein [Lysobacter humi (ex Lee et al. 2017)]
MPKKVSTNGSGATAGAKANRSETNAAARKGRRKADPIGRLRSQVWYCLVCAQKQTPWDDPAAMDRLFLKPERGPYRVFKRIREHCSNPGLKDRKLNGASVVERVAAKPGYLHTQAAYESPLWDLLSGAPWSPTKRESEIARLLQQFALYESGPEDKFILNTLDAPDFRGVKRSRAHFRRVLQSLARKRLLDAILLLCLFYRRYLEGGRLGEARDVRDAVLKAIHRYCARPGFHGDVHTLWVFITRRRVFAGQPCLEHTPKALSDAREWLAGWAARCTSPQAQALLEEQIWLWACLKENAEEIPVSYLVQRNLDVDRFVANRDELQAQALAAALAARPAPDLDASVSAATRFAELRGHRE